MPETNPKIEWLRNSGKSCLKFTFAKHLTLPEAKSAIADWRKIFAEKPGERIVLIWDCLAMKGYDSGARILWQEALRDLGGQVDSVWMIGGSDFIKMGAASMGLAVPINIRSVKSEKEIEFS